METTLESSIAPHLLREDRQPKHRPGSHQPPYPSFSARFPSGTTSVVMAYYGIQVEDPAAPALAEALAEIAGRFALQGGPESWDRAHYVDAQGWTTVLSIAYWSDPTAHTAWQRDHGAWWTEPERAQAGIGHFLELVTPSVDRFETIFSADDKAEGVAGAASGMSGMIEEHAYWGSMRDRLPVGQADALWPAGEPVLLEDGPVRTVVLHENACLIRSGQDLSDTGEVERAAYVGDVEPSLVAGMDFLRDEGASIGCYDNRFMTVLDEGGKPTSRTFGLSWWRDLGSLEDWASSHPTHVQIFGVAMRHLSSFGPDTRLRLYHEVTVPDGHQQRFVYVGCHDRTGLLRALVPVGG